MSRRPAWTPRVYTCSAHLCATSAEGAFRHAGQAFFEPPPGWFFTPIEDAAGHYGIVFFCSPACTRVLSAETDIKTAWRVPCRHCATSGVSTRINAPDGSAILALPSGWSAFVFAAGHGCSSLNIACSRRCLRLHARALEKPATPPPPPKLRLV